MLDTHNRGHLLVAGKEVPSYPADVSFYLGVVVGEVRDGGGGGDQVRPDRKGQSSEIALGKGKSEFNSPVLGARQVQSFASAVQDAVYVDPDQLWPSKLS